MFSINCLNRKKAMVKWIKNNQEHLKEYRKRYNKKAYAKNKKFMKKYLKKWRKSKTGKLIVKSHNYNRRILLKNNKYKLTPHKFKKVFLKSNGKCPYCFTPIFEDSFSLDHIKPISKSGTNHLNNLIACCKTCNFKKHDSLLKDFKRDLLESKKFT